MKKVDIVIPCLNEENVLEQSIDTLRNFLKENMSEYDNTITIADNGSTDATLEIAKRLTEQYPEVRFNTLDKKGRGRALKKTWSESDADIVSYMDVDLSTDLKALPPMINAIANENYHLGTGTRLAKNSNTKRGFKRDFISRVYNLMVKTILWTKYSDAQCGFKAVDKKIYDQLHPVLKDNEWFFDTEMLTIAEKKGFKLFEIPVTWIEDTDSRVKIINTAYKYIRDLIRLRTRIIFKKI
jgi:glycosyltransferase involved in cell wall biosynthesis